MDDEQRLIERREIKRRRLHELDKQAAMYGADTPPHVEMERTQLRYELGIVETAINSPARTAIGDELGAAGRFMYSSEQQRQVLETARFIGTRLDEFIKDSLAWRTMSKALFTIIIIALLFLIVAVVAIVTYLATRGSL